VKAYSLIEVLIAAHLSAFVDADEFPERGGLMLIAPPGNMKSTFIKSCYRSYMPSAIIMSDVNVETLNKMRDKMAQGYIRTLALPAFEKIYERNPQTAKNIEGHLKALVDEGFNLPSFRDQQMLGQSEARCLVVGGIVQACYARHFSNWEENGFNRRFVWSSFQLADPYVLVAAIHNWQRIEFDHRMPAMPQRRIKMNVTIAESLEVRHMLDQQGCGATPYALIKKILSVLKWRYNRPGDEKKPMQIMRDFSQSLGQKMAKLTL
jgi:hypothetical protein